jgi:hypothetical protein
MKTIAAVISATALLSSFAAASAYADGGMSVAQARAACEKRGEAGDPKKLRACCDNLISPQADAKKERQMIAECVAGGGKATAKAQKKQ